MKNDIFLPFKKFVKLRVCHSARWQLRLSLGTAFAVKAAIYPSFPVRQLEYMRQFLLGRCDAARIPAFYDVGHAFWKPYGKFTVQLTIANDINRDVRIHIAQHIKINIYDLIDLNNILSPHLAARHILENRYGTFHPVQSKDGIQFHGQPRLDVVKDNSV